MNGERIRYQQTGEFHFLTFSCYRCRPYLTTAAAMDLFEDALERVRQRYLFAVAGYVVMPEHVHLLVNEPRARSPLKGDSGPQTVGFDAEPGTALLAGALLRFQRLGAREVCGEAALHPSQPGSSRAGGATGGLAVVELSPLPNGHARNCGDRIGLDSPTERLAASRVDARSPGRLLDLPGSLNGAKVRLPGPQKLGTGGTLEWTRFSLRLGTPVALAFRGAALPRV